MRRSFDQFEHEGVSPVLLLDAVNRADVRMAQGGQNLRLPLKPRQPVRITGQELGQDFQSHIPVQPGIGGSIDLTHSAFTELLGDSVVSEGSSDHRE